MITIRGKGVSGGIASGKLCFYHSPQRAVVRQTVEDQAAERARLEKAQAETVAQLEALAAQCRTAAGEENARLFETHILFVWDEDFADAIHGVMAAEQCDAAYAVQQAGEQFAARLAALEDPYLRARAADIRDVAGRLLGNLTGTGWGGIHTEEPVILAADDLSPSETLQLDRSKILAFVTRGGSDTSHTAILARTMGIPALCGAGAALEEGLEGRLCCIDGENGVLYIEPDAQTRAEMDAKRAQQTEQARLYAEQVGQEDVTLDGQPVLLYCNIGAPADVDAVQHNDGRGIGLFRSEFLYLAADDYPTEEVQFAAYRAVAEAMEGKRVVIRTLDIGADKQADYFGLPQEENPALGYRAIRICLDRPAVFRTQLRALYRASAYGKVAIMFPMIASVWEVRECKRACRAVMEELRAEGIPFRAETELGIMIETPAAVLIAEELAREVDFFSVGTNDLTQYTLACDRQATDLGRFFDPHHPAVLRAIGMAADAAHRAGIWIGICGELAADLELLPTFLALGIDELSVSPAAVLPLRAAIRQSRAKP